MKRRRPPKLRKRFLSKYQVIGLSQTNNEVKTLLARILRK